MASHATEVKLRSRFGFGRNWGRFLTLISPERIADAENSLKEKLGLEDLTGHSLLDAGSGSGLFSLAARRLGATVTSFDFDPESVACTRELRRRYARDDPNWIIS